MRKSITLALSLALAVPAAFGQIGIGPIHNSVPSANPRVDTPDTVISAGFQLKTLAVGTDVLENPSPKITQFGLLADGTRTEPDQNLYLVLDHVQGPTPGYNYGHHFLFQGHENSGDLAYVTRINLDVTDPAHRITLLTPEGADGFTHFNSVDGSTYDPISKTLFFTEEAGSGGGVFQVSLTWPATVTTLDGILGKAGYEGIHPDDRGNLLIIEDTGGTGVNINPADPSSPKTAKQPNSFVYRFLPNDPRDITQGGKLQALQVSINHQPVVFHASDPVGDTFSTNQLLLHTPGTSYPVRWVTVHDTDVDGTASFDANALAKTAGATPFKRPENAQFLPGSDYRTFFFCPTGDTDAPAGSVPALAARGSWGSIFRVDLARDRNSGRISIFVLGDAAHASFDNLTFADFNTLLATEDRGDSLHAQLNTLDSVWAFSLDRSHSTKRFVALGRDATSEAAGEDNEPTGLHVSNGSPFTFAQPGSPLNLFFARGFLTRQHGDNVVWEIVKQHR
ncbi:MAG TPA: alkaline phosphatase PhoX [Terriglobales bacterium]|nr:alkaline phosphatase PhoX [Terriglobales bacterium]